MHDDTTARHEISLERSDSPWSPGREKPGWKLPKDEPIIEELDPDTIIPDEMEVDRNYEVFDPDQPTPNVKEHDYSVDIGSLTIDDKATPTLKRQHSETPQKLQLSQKIQKRDPAE